MVDKVLLLCPPSAITFILYDFTECRLYSEANSLSDLRILQRIIKANTITAISPGINAVPKDPVVINVPICYTPKATVYPVASWRQIPPSSHFPLFISEFIAPRAAKQGGV